MMRMCFLAVVLTFAQEPQIEWRPSVDIARQEARRTGRNVLVTLRIET